MLRLYVGFLYGSFPPQPSPHGPGGKEQNRTPEQKLRSIGEQEQHHADHGFADRTVSIYGGVADSREGRDRDGVKLSLIFFRQRSAEGCEVHAMNQVLSLRFHLFDLAANALDRLLYFQY